MQTGKEDKTKEDPNDQKKDFNFDEDISFKPTQEGEEEKFDPNAEKRRIIMAQISGPKMLQMEQMSQRAKASDEYYRKFIKMSGYSWAIALVTGGVALGLWRLFSPPHHPTPHAESVNHVSNIQRARL